MAELAELVASMAAVAELAFPFSGPTKLSAVNAPVEGTKLSLELAVR